MNQSIILPTTEELPKNHSFRILQFHTTNFNKLDAHVKQPSTFLSLVAVSESEMQIHKNGDSKNTWYFNNHLQSCQRLSLVIRKSAWTQICIYTQVSWFIFILFFLHYFHSLPFFRIWVFGLLNSSIVVRETINHFPISFRSFKPMIFSDVGGQRQLFSAFSRLSFK